jgi:hypothetical protein
MDSSALGHTIGVRAGSDHRRAVPKILQRDGALRGGLMHRMAREWLGSTSSDSDPLRWIEQVPGKFGGVASWGRFHPESIKGGCESFLNKAPSEKPESGPRAAIVPLIEIRDILRVVGQ